MPKLLCFTLLLIHMVYGISIGLRRTAQYYGRNSFTRLFSKKVVFLGTPDVAARALQILSDASKDASRPKDSSFEIIAVVSQPPAPAGRNKKLTSSPVQILAEKLGIPVLTPETAKDELFLTNLENLKPDLCITAAYGNFLPKRFLSIPSLGTLNIHPSLLPKYRGAAPVQRSLQNGDSTSGVTVCLTKLKMDAGPIVKQVQVPLTGDEKSVQFLETMFDLGAHELLGCLETFFTGKSELREQDHTQATSADKLDVRESKIDFGTMTAREIHNKVRAFAGWPGTWSSFTIIDDLSAPVTEKMKIVSTFLVKDSEPSSPSRKIALQKCTLPPPSSSSPPPKPTAIEYLHVVCYDGSVLGITEIQPLSKKSMPVKAYVNGLRGRGLEWTSPDIVPDSE